MVASFEMSLKAPVISAYGGNRPLKLAKLESWMTLRKEGLRIKQKSLSIKGYVDLTITM